MRGVLRRAGPAVAKIPVPIGHSIASAVHAWTRELNGQRNRAGQRRRGDDEAGRGNRHITDLVEEAGVQPVGAAGILGVEPLHGVCAGRNGICFLRPAQPGSRNLVLWISVQIKFKEVMIGFAGYLPPEGQGAGAGDRGLQRMTGMLMVDAGFDGCSIVASENAKSRRFL